LSTFLLCAAVIGTLAAAAVKFANAQARQERPDEFEDVLANLFAWLDAGVRYRKVHAGDVELVNRLDAVDTATIEQHFAKLGDVILEQETATPIRVFGHKSEEVIAYVVPSTKGVGVGMESYSLDEEFVTTKDPLVQREFIAYPPFSHHAYVPVTSTLPEMLAQHREFVRTTARSALARVATLDDAIRQFEEFANRVRAWRWAQDPDVLLESDLRAALGESRFAREGVYWMRRLKLKRSKLPRARVRQAAPRDH
jgi:hypothetical protein